MLEASEQESVLGACLGEPGLPGIRREGRNWGGFSWRNGKQCCNDFFFSLGEQGPNKFQKSILLCLPLGFFVYVFYLFVLQPSETASLDMYLGHKNGK